ncbi:MAG: ferrochelatase [Halobacteriales archaeon]
MTAGVFVLNFGEPATPDREAVVEYLRRIFLQNADLDDAEDPEARARELAERRAPGLIGEYEAIGGSPLNEQAAAQADALGAALADRGFDVETYVGMQFTEPFIEDAVERARADGVDLAVGLPVYPLCGPSTTVAALDRLETAIEDHGWDVPTHAVTGWHKHPTYARLRAENVAAAADAEGLDLTVPDTALVFSAHGTPQHYLEEGSRYERYVEEHCETVAGLLGVESYELGYQNHENRDIPWTEPEVEDVIETIDAERVLVEPVSFMHEQSETLSELDVELREEAEERGLSFRRVPIPHDDERFPDLLADLVEPFLAGIDPATYNLQPCLCRDAAGTVCLNAGPNRMIEGAYPVADD